MDKTDAIQALFTELRAAIEDMASIDPTEAIFFNPVTEDNTGEDVDMRNNINRACNEARHAVNGLELLISATAANPASHPSAPPNASMSELQLIEDIIKVLGINSLMDATKPIEAARVRQILTDGDYKRISQAIGARVAVLAGV